MDFWSNEVFAFILKELIWIFSLYHYISGEASSSDVTTCERDLRTQAVGDEHGHERDCRSGMSISGVLSNFVNVTICFMK